LPAQIFSSVTALSFFAEGAGGRFSKRWVLIQRDLRRLRRWRETIASVVAVSVRLHGASPWYLSISNLVTLLLRRRLNIYVNPLITAKYSAAKNKQSSHNNNHEYHQDGNDPGTSTPTITISHNSDSSLE